MPRWTGVKLYQTPEISQRWRFVTGRLIGAPGGQVFSLAAELGRGVHFERLVFIPSSTMWRRRRGDAILRREILPVPSWVSSGLTKLRTREGQQLRVCSVLLGFGDHAEHDTASCGADEKTRKRDLLPEGERR